MKLTIFWFRRDLRLEDNVALHHALNTENKVLPIFIFDENLLHQLPKDDARVTFIHQTLSDLDKKLKENNSSLWVKKGKPLSIFKELVEEYPIHQVFTNHDYEPQAIKRDKEIQDFLSAKGIEFQTYKDQVIFEKEEVIKEDGLPYTVFTPYKNKWLKVFNSETDLKEFTVSLDKFYSFNDDFPTLESIGFTTSKIKVKPYQLDRLQDYKNLRDYPALDATSYLSPYLRFGLVSVRKVVKMALEKNPTFLSELIWREFFMQILYHYPKVIKDNFRSKYDGIEWRNNEEEFQKWCNGETGYPMVDAGMRELNETGYMHNRVRMITAGFLCKHLLIDWRWGEAYFAQKLLDFELASNNGNWQWAAGTGCDAAPYFRVFNPETQLKKFDKELTYVRKWVKDFDELTYPQPMVEHKMARQRALEVYKKGIEN